MGTMNFTALVDVAIGTILVYVGVSILVSIMSEFVSNLLSLRKRQLAISLATLFNQGKLDKLPQLGPLADALRTAGSYVDPKVLAQIVISVVKEPGPPAANSGERLAASLLSNIEMLPDSQLKAALSTIARSTEKSADKIVHEVSDTIDRSLKVLGEAYKKWISRVTFALGLLIAFGGNLDTVGLVSRLYADKELRDELVTTADRYVKQASPELVANCPHLSEAELKKQPGCGPVLELGRAIKNRSGSIGKLPFGWSHGFHPFDATLPQAFGWLLTAFAASLGAPFWFDLLNRIGNVRRVIARPEPQAPDS